MQQYFLDEKFEEKEFTLNEDDSFHILRVMRKKVGASIYIVFSDKKKYVCSIVDINNKCVNILPISAVADKTELPTKTKIAIPPLKSDKIEYLIQKSTELGVREIIIFNSERNIAKIKSDKLNLKLKRWEKIAKEASEQSKRSLIPSIKYVDSIRNLINENEDIDYKVIAYENESQNENNNNLSKLLNSDLFEKSVIAVFGSEGGFSEKEVLEFNNCGYSSIGLGRRILRAETAPLYFLSCVAYFSEIN
ncbi:MULTISPECIES: 16S rRNA (uracil(1498)-N(3))-methyltransferase [unclassified Gemella]|uniref:RsmE family RNA methyltransferase n=1 Tax=unclassified Gemella TaxID=2624949 RepID=UPI001C051961|nr:MULTISPECIES: RsmE family RNA methyltransferase [unclassified Gemella]MBU0278287.1 16S rRNA (uracil(1498)-N(3))-methyltransferase [Gemella sp. zg-1178]QWQ38207.1 16S rRNA (uracil(1498)-N(3))-methyltransferase [Gemella sp. zg-570]